jgi:glutamyl-tRNA synthetase
MLRIKGKDDEEVLAILQTTAWRLDGLRDFRADAIQILLRETAEAFGVKLRDFNAPFYAALSGSPVWTPLFASMEILGPDLVRARLRNALEALGGVSGKRLKKLEKDYAARFGPRH